MHYLKVKWIHEHADEPYLIYGELSDELEELRKIEIFKNGKIGYAQLNGVEYNAFSSTCNWPKKEEIESDPQFQVTVIMPHEFEILWKQALSQNIPLI